ncbi:MAG: RNA-binding transcriptional accessory protein [Deltaproteobacteria bacterium]|nr:RNA-binding transcriptional accessory protein [Deltaproteobacteria bacterium]
MNPTHITKIAQELNISPKQVEATAALLAEDATVPFIARYRKEATGSLDEVAITAVRDRLAQLEDLDKRREAILKSITEQGKMTDELHAKIMAAETMTVLEDLYLPYKPKRRTRATIAKERGLEPLAQILWEQGTVDPLTEAKAFINAEKEVSSEAEALAGARDIMAEWVSEDAPAREELRELYFNKGEFHSQVIPGKETEGSKFADYFDWHEPVTTAPSHRVLAMRRGEKEEFLSLRIRVPEEDAVGLLTSRFVKAKNTAAEQVAMAVQDSYKRLLSLSIETETRLVTKKRADEAAITVFADNLRQLLLASPLGQKMVLALDPGFRTGCKLVILGRQGQLIHSTAIFPHSGERSAAEAATALRTVCEKFPIEAIAIGNGTASRETEAFVRQLDLPKSITLVMVNESGASVYSASEVAREEFPDHDVTVRGAVSIGRRLMDPLAELVKIDPKSIGVGQYQHDVDEGALQQRLDDVVMSCVNSVGVEVNTASKQLLTYVSGLGPQLAQNIVTFRDANGPFTSRQDLRKVPRLGPKAFEQAAGFLRIRDGQHPLDASAVHPERYSLVETIAKDLKCTVSDLLREEATRRQIALDKYVTNDVGLPTLNDIMSELAKPGRDPRAQFEVVRFAEGVEKLEDVKPGMKLPGIVTNVTAFGAFVDIGVHQDGLVHISQLANQFVKNPHDVVKVQQKVNVTVLEVDVARKRISLSMRDDAAPVPAEAAKAPRQTTQSRPPQPNWQPPPQKPRQEGFSNRLVIPKLKG